MLRRIKLQLAVNKVNRDLAYAKAISISLLRVRILHDESAIEKKSPANFSFHTNHMKHDVIYLETLVSWKTKFAVV
jgi:hypothetical protein